MARECRFPKVKPKSRVDYASLPTSEQVKRVSLSLAYWYADERISPGIRHKLRLINPETLVRVFNDFDGWQLYGNRRIGVVEKVNIILVNYEKVRK